ncbi:hypothetical protein GDO78_015135 [Eleutherodactylus coqui]|uniref:Uncharacterized protein n=1 Tax=Eleutherodactylus coqui TaxID=57060 RepID=A0A8J6EL72_ELECQ|nr:hypothetical protein GDO78_015135 [Eleutherodactylus coqui]
MQRFFFRYFEPELQWRFQRCADPYSALVICFLSKVFGSDRVARILCGSRTKICMNAARTWRFLKQSSYTTKTHAMSCEVVIDGVNPRMDP